jgi:hypothetical protein
LSPSLWSFASLSGYDPHTNFLIPLEITGTAP